MGSANNYDPVVTHLDSLDSVCHNSYTAFMKTWQVQEAKQRFSEVVRSAQDAPQFVTKNGAAAAVIISMEEYRKRFSPAGGIQDFLINAPKIDSLPLPEREPSGAREEALDELFETFSEAVK